MKSELYPERETWVSMCGSSGLALRVEHAVHRVRTSVIVVIPSERYPVIGDRMFGSVQGNPPGYAETRIRSWKYTMGDPNPRDGRCRAVQTSVG